MTPLQIDESFRHEYKVEHLVDAPGGKAERFYYPGGKREGKDGLLLEIVPDDGGTWIGTFQFGSVTQEAITGIYSFPHPQKLCVVAKGNGFIVDVNDPQSFDHLNLVPILDVIPISEKGVLVFATFTLLAAYDSDGLKWKTERLAWDDFKVVEATSRSIVGKTWDMRREEYVPFEVDVDTGIHSGGINELI